ncbi:uncharacterized protein DS421_20g699640 [Arachis hypogaea]|nr:uncharacterized protein DS421_20g699640 [Arachis hypogaea]
MAESQGKRVSSEDPLLCTSPSRNSLMEVDIVEPLECVASDDSKNLSYEQENLAGNVAGHAHEPSKVSNLDPQILPWMFIVRLVFRFSHNVKEYFNCMVIETCNCNSQLRCK